jgi:hypothetical protein
MKWQADWLLAKEENEKARFLQFLQQVCWATIATLVFTPYSYFKRKNYKVTEINLSEDYSTLCLNSIQHMLLATLIDKLKVL